MLSWHKEKIPDIITFNTATRPDERGSLTPIFDGGNFRVATTRIPIFTHEIETRSRKHVFRGMHYQIKHPQGKLVRCIKGDILDIVVDMRRWSPTFGMDVSKRLIADSYEMLWIPPGFAHGFFTLSDESVVQYKLTAEWELEPHARVLSWRYVQNRVYEALGETISPVLSWKDFQGEPFIECKFYESPEELT